jgi:hypothetical protein
LEVEQSVVGWDYSSFNFHSTLTSVLGALLIRHQGIEMCQPTQEGRLTPMRMMKGFHHEQLAVQGIMRLID